MIHLVHESCLSEWADRQVVQMQGPVCLCPCPGGCGENYRVTRSRADVLKRIDSVFSKQTLFCYAGALTFVFIIKIL